MLSRRHLLFQLLVLVFCAALGAAPAACADALSYARRIPIQYGGRVQSFDVFAEQQLELISGKASWNGEPAALWCADETDGESLRACQQIYEPLLNFKPGGVEVEPWLAEKYVANADATEYTFTLRKDVTFTNGGFLDANDVVASFASQWDAKSPNYKGRTTTFEYFGAFFGTHLNAPPAE